MQKCFALAEGADLNSLGAFRVTPVRGCQQRASADAVIIRCKLAFWVKMLQVISRVIFFCALSELRGVFVFVCLFRFVYVCMHVCLPE